MKGQEFLIQRVARDARGSAEAFQLDCGYPKDRDSPHWDVEVVVFEERDSQHEMWVICNPVIKTDALTDILNEFRQVFCYPAETSVRVAFRSAKLLSLPEI